MGDYNEAQRRASIRRQAYGGDNSSPTGLSLEKVAAKKNLRARSVEKERARKRCRVVTVVAFSEPPRRR